MPKLMIGKKLRKGERVKIRSDLKAGVYDIHTGEHALNNDDIPTGWNPPPIIGVDDVKFAGKVMTIKEVYDEGHNGFYCRFDEIHNYWHVCLLEMMEIITCSKCGKDACTNCGMCLHCLSKSYIEKLNEFYLSVREICKEHPMMSDKISRLWQGFMKQKRSAKSYGKYELEEFPERFFEEK